MKPADYYPLCSREVSNDPSCQPIVCAPLLGWNHAGWLLSYAVVARNILEYGSGGSTLWLASHCPDAQITSVEHNPHWVVAASGALTALRRIQCHRNDTVIVVSGGHGRTYTNPLIVEQRKPFDLIFIDGVHEERTSCLKASYELLAAGGVVFLDNSEEPAYEEGKEWLLSQPGMTLIGETTDPTWNPQRSNRHLWAAQKDE